MFVESTLEESDLRFKIAVTDFYNTKKMYFAFNL